MNKSLVGTEIVNGEQIFPYKSEGIPSSKSKGSWSIMDKIKPT